MPERSGKAPEGGKLLINPFPRITKTLSGLGDATGTNAARAHTHALSSLTDDNVDALEIRFPTSFRQIVGMTYPMTINRALIANLTASHEGILPREMNPEYNTCYNPRALLNTRSSL
jgi:hypothetical protein